MYAQDVVVNNSLSAPLANCNQLTVGLPGMTCAGPLFLQDTTIGLQVAGPSLFSSTHGVTTAGLLNAAAGLVSPTLDVSNFLQTDSLFVGSSGAVITSAFAGLEVKGPILQSSTHGLSITGALQSPNINNSGHITTTSIEVGVNGATFLGPVSLPSLSGLTSAGLVSASGFVAGTSGITSDFLNLNSLTVGTNGATFTGGLFVHEPFQGVQVTGPVTLSSTHGLTSNGVLSAPSILAGSNGITTSSMLVGTQGLTSAGPLFISNTSVGLELTGPASFVSTHGATFLGAVSVPGLDVGTMGLVSQSMTNTGLLHTNSLSVGTNGSTFSGGLNVNTLLATGGITCSGFVSAANLDVGFGATVANLVVTGTNGVFSYGPVSVNNTSTGFQVTGPSLFASTHGVISNGSFQAPSVVAGTGGLSTPLLTVGTSGATLLGPVVLASTHGLTSNGVLSSSSLVVGTHGSTFNGPVYISNTTTGFQLTGPAQFLSTHALFYFDKNSQILRFSKITYIFRHIC